MVKEPYKVRKETLDQLPPIERIIADMMIRDGKIIMIDKPFIIPAITDDTGTR